MLRDIWRSFFEVISPIKAAIMLAIIALISAFIAFVGYDFMSKNLPFGISAPLSGLLGISIFLVLVFCVVAIQRILQGEDIEFPKGVGKGKFNAMYREAEEIFDVPIFLPVKNRDKYNEIVCYSVLEKFEIVYDEEKHLVDKISKKLKEENFRRSNLRNLQWEENNNERPDCEVTIPARQERLIEIAHFRFLLKKSFEQGKPRAILNIQYCEKKKVDKEQLGLYEVRISVNYKKNGGEIRTKYFDGYIYANVFEEENLEDDIRNRMQGIVILDEGSWKKNDDVPKPVVRKHHAT